MKSKLPARRRRRAYLNAEIKKIRDQYPHVDFKDWQLRRAMERHYELTKQLIYVEVDIKFCEGDEAGKRCRGCDCPKSWI